MIPNCLIDQPCGLGDIFYCQKIAFALKQNNYNVIWPVKENLLYIKEYLPDFINFITAENNVLFTELIHANVTRILENDKHDIYIPLKNANHIYGRPVMQAKYKLLNIDPSDWLEFFIIKRNTVRENHLYYDILKLKDSSKYSLYNRQYGTPPGTVISDKIKLPTQNDFIEMKYYTDINLLDWCKVIENAIEIFTIDTSILFIIDFLFKNKNLKLNVWSRQMDFIDIDQIFKTNYTKHY